MRIGAGEVQWLTETWVRQREPTPDELSGLVAEFLKEELLAREARELRLDQNDTIVRRRLAQKLNFLIEDTSRCEPTEADLRRFYEARRALPGTGARVVHACLFQSRATEDGRGCCAGSPVATRRQNPRWATASFSPEFRDANEQAVTRLRPRLRSRCSRFSRGAGPVESGYGLHLVRISGVEPTRSRAFSDVRAQVLGGGENRKRRRRSVISASWRSTTW